MFGLGGEKRVRETLVVQRFGGRGIEVAEFKFLFHDVTFHSVFLSKILSGIEVVMRLERGKYFMKRSERVDLNICGSLRRSRT